MGVTRRAVLGVVGGTLLGAGVLSNEQSLRKAVDRPNFRKTTPKTVPAHGFSNHTISWGGDEPVIMIFTMEVSGAQITSWVTPNKTIQWKKHSLTINGVNIQQMMVKGVLWNVS